jgi:hypothetical protein
MGLWQQGAAAEEVLLLVSHCPAAQELPPTAYHVGSAGLAVCLANSLFYSRLLVTVFTWFQGDCLEEKQVMHVQDAEFSTVLQMLDSCFL